MKHPVPKRRTSTKRKKQRYGAYALKVKKSLTEKHTLSKCPSCGEMKLNHFICPNCGKYKNKQIITQKSGKTPKTIKA